jgi:hypothetical protein
MKEPAVLFTEEEEQRLYTQAFFQIFDTHGYIYQDRFFDYFHARFNNELAVL